MAKPGPKPINGEPLSPKERQARARERATEKRAADLNKLLDAIRAMRDARTIREAREIAAQTLGENK